LMTRGQVRIRRLGLSRSSISAKTAVVAAAGGSGGKGRWIIDLAADEADGADEADLVRVAAGVVSGPAHQLPDRVVGKQDSPHLLFDEFRGLGAEDPPGGTQVGLDLIQPGFVFPALVIGERYLRCGQRGRVQDGGDYADQLAVLAAAVGTVYSAARTMRARSSSIGAPARAAASRVALRLAAVPGAKISAR
jgi:hypothetical protein